MSMSEAKEEFSCPSRCCCCRWFCSLSWASPISSISFCSWITWTKSQPVSGANSSKYFALAYRAILPFPLFSSSFTSVRTTLQLQTSTSLKAHCLYASSRNCLKMEGWGEGLVNSRILTSHPPHRVTSGQGGRGGGEDEYVGETYRTAYLIFPPVNRCHVSAHHLVVLLQLKRLGSHLLQLLYHGHTVCN